jgi:Spy/CpxP family protein refolding chaperone
MKTTTKVILGFSTVALLATSAIAYQGKNSSNCNMKNNHHKMMKMKNHKKGGHIIGTIMRLDLTPTQRDAIGKILQENRDSQTSPLNAFTTKEFNKDKFVKLMQEKKAARIEKKAETIAKVYAVLNDIQKKNLKLMLDKKQKAKGGNCRDKNCNGRR